jgi:hypothetical protein
MCYATLRFTRTGAVVDTAVFTRVYHCDAAHDIDVKRLCTHALFVILMSLSSSSSSSSSSNY